MIYTMKVIKLMLKYSLITFNNIKVNNNPTIRPKGSK